MQPQIHCYILALFFIVPSLAKYLLKKALGSSYVCCKRLAILVPVRENIALTVNKKQLDCADELQ